MLPSRNQATFSMGCAGSSAHSVLWVYHQAAFQLDYCRFPCSLLRSLPLLQGKSFPLPHFPAGSLSWISAAQWERFVSERERIIGWLCVPELSWGHRDTRWVCINQEHTGSFSKPDLRGRSWGVWEEGGQFQRCCKQLKARTQQTHETSSRHKESKAECWYLTNNT